MDDSSPPQRTMPVREDCWSEEASSTLVDAWGKRYMELNRGNLRQKDWQEVADTVNARHGHSKKTFRTDVQCKNRIDTIKKKYKTEKARVSDSNGVLVSNWPFYDRLDDLIGPNVKKVASSGGGGGSSSGKGGVSMSLPMALPYRKNGNNAPPVVTVTPVMLPKKRAAPNDDLYFRRNYSTVAAAAASMEMDEGDQDEEDERTEEDREESERSRSSEERDEEMDGDADGIKKLANAIKRFGEIYAKVEGEKQRQMVELEKQKMQFAKELEVQRMQMFMNTQVQLEKIKHSKGSDSDDIYS